MARYEHLPIYKKAMDVSVYIKETVRNFSRYHKYGIGNDLREVIRLVIRANSTEHKAPVLQVMLVLAKEVKVLSEFQKLSTCCGSGNQFVQTERVHEIFRFGACHA